MTAAARMATPELLERLRRHYIKPGDPLPGGMFLPEVTHGQAGGRRVDALYVGFARSRGLHLIGHELKVSRADWIHELESIQKAEVWASQCHAWYLVAADPSICPIPELPHGWGLMIPGPSKTRMQIVVKATVDPAVQPSWTATHSILKRVDTLRALAVADAREKARRENDQELADLRGQAAMLQLAVPDAERARADRLEALLTELGQILGVPILDPGGSWSQSPHLSTVELRTDLAAFIRAGRDVSTALDYKVRNLEYTLRDLEQAATSVRAAHRKLTQEGLSS